MRRRIAPSDRTPTLGRSQDPLAEHQGRTVDSPDPSSGARPGATRLRASAGALSSAARAAALDGWLWHYSHHRRARLSQPQVPDHPACRAEQGCRVLQLHGHAGRLARGGGGSAGALDGRAAVDVLGSESVADPEVRVDVAPVRRDLLELLAQLAHEDVHRPVAVDHRVAPDALVDLLAGDDLTAEVAEERDQLELAAGEVHAAAGREGLELVPPDLELAGHHG